VKALAIATVAWLGFVGTSLAHPLDSPGTVYIDGVPCNLPCQHYLAWSRQSLEADHPSAKGTANASVVRELRKTPRTRISKSAEPALADRSRQKNSRGSQTALKVTPKSPPAPTWRTETPSDMETRNPTAPLVTAAEPKPSPKSETENAPLTVGSSNPLQEKSPHDAVLAALSVAEKITNAELSKALENDRANETKVGDTNVPASGSLVALVLSRPDLKSVSALNGQDVAIDRPESTIETEIRSALAAMGATEARVSVSSASPLDRLISGDVQAALVKLVSPDAAKAFPDIKGFKVLRVPLFPQ
jgi:hypothetical protein